MTDITANKEYLDRAYQAFLDNPTAESYLTLSVNAQRYIEFVAIVETLNIYESKKPQIKILKTKNYPHKNKQFAEIQDLFRAMEWTIVPYKATEQIESWKVRDKEKNTAILYLDTNGFSMGAATPNGKLKGNFEGYEDIDVFTDWLATNDIEVED